MLDLAALSVNLNTIYAPIIADQLNNRVPLLARLPKTLGSGKNISWNAKLARGTSSASYASGANITGDDSRPEVPAVLNWKRLKAEFKVAGDALAAALSAGPAAYANLLGKEIQEAARDLGIELGRQMYLDGTGNGALDIDGLAAIVANTGTYAAIDRGQGANAQWRATVMGNSGVDRALTVDLMRQAEQKVFDASGAAPNLIVTTSAIYRKYEALFDTPKRYNADQSQSFDAGAMFLAFKGIPIVRDPRCPAKKMYFLSTDSTEFQQLPPIITQAGTELVQALTPITAQDGAIGLQVAIEMLGKAGDSYKGFIKLYGNLKCEHPNRNAVISDIDEA